MRSMLSSSSSGGGGGGKKICCFVERSEGERERRVLESREFVVKIFGGGVVPKNQLATS
jgi:hypothetical protein